MSSTRAAIRYAKAILEIADSKKVASEVSADMALIAKTITGNSELSSFIQNPLIVTDTKKDVVSEVFVSVNAVTKSLFQLLLENKRFEILDGIAAEYNKLFDIMNGVEVAKVTTAIPMDAALEAKVLAKIATFSSSKKITIENTVDPSIIGGFILRIGDKQYNASIADRLQVLKRELSN
jgi:F-type H+-transporting ATPase subunit delta